MEHDHILTVAQAAGLINAGVTIASITFPMLLAIVITGILKNTNNAATWSVLGFLLNGSLWPHILRTDTVSTTHVSKQVVLVSVIATLGVWVMAVVGPLTPVGLYLSTSTMSTKEVLFSYVRDDISPIGRSTPDHGTYMNNRLCGLLHLINCPGSEEGFHFYVNKTDGDLHMSWHKGKPRPYISSHIAPNITEAFTSATNKTGSTISSIFDIQWRFFYNYNNETRSRLRKIPPDPWIDRNAPRSNGLVQYSQSLVLSHGYVVLEGLIADTIHGGIGFRNHTMPPASQSGFEWEEDLLWLEPDSKCVDLNITLEYTLPDLSWTWDPINPRITDRGGMVNLVDHYPWLDISHAQSNPVIRDRALKGAIETIYNLMIYFKETRNMTHVGKTYPVSPINLAPNKLTMADASSERGGSFPFHLGNGFDNVLSSKKFLEVGITSTGFGGGDAVDINRIMVRTGTIMGPASRLDENGKVQRILGPESIILTPGTEWQHSIYFCASAIKASVKRVSFRSSGTSSIANLNVTSVKPIEYHNETSKPLWGMEVTKINITDIDPFWGIVADEYENSTHLSTVRADHFYIPAAAAGLWGIYASDASAGATAPAGALNEVWNWQYGVDGPDSSATTNFALFQKWQKLSQSPDTAKTIIDLIWTEIMANNVVGARSRFSRDGSGLEPEGPDVHPHTMGKVTPFEQHIAYDYRYGVPAFVFLAMYTILFVLAVGLLVTRRFRFSTLRLLLNHTAAGRAAMTERHPRYLTADAKTSEWARLIGDEQMSISKDMTSGNLKGHETGAVEDVEHSSEVPPKAPAHQVSDPVGDGSS